MAMRSLHTGNHVWGVVRECLTYDCEVSAYRETYVWMALRECFGYGYEGYEVLDTGRHMCGRI